MTFHVLPIGFKPGRLKGLPPALMASHYENNYGGAVRRLNAIRDELVKLDPATVPGFRLNGLKREELIASNSMLLHEVYFDSLGEDGEAPPEALATALARDFGSLARWRAEFAAMGRALAGGSGWVVLTRSPRDGTLSNVWGADHSCALAGGTPCSTSTSTPIIWRSAPTPRPMSRRSWPTCRGAAPRRVSPVPRRPRRTAWSTQWRPGRCSRPIPTCW
ncbi:MAG: Fe-Mn family superoxide dismutase [Reyranellaceae bacterium]